MWFHQLMVLVQLSKIRKTELDIYVNVRGDMRELVNREEYRSN